MAAYESRRAGRNRKLDRVISTLYRSLKLSTPKSHISDTTISSTSSSSDAKLTTLFSRVIDTKSGKLIANPGSLRPDKYRAIKIQCIWYNARVTLSFTNHTEYTTCTATLDLSGTPPLEYVEPAERKRTTYHDLHDVLKKLAESPSLAEVECNRIYGIIYRDIWALFEEEILYPLLRLQGGLGPAFVDFRGLYLGAGSSEMGSGEICESPAPPAAKRFTSPFEAGGEANPFDPDRDHNCRIQCVRDVWPLLKCEVGDNVEFTVSTFLGGRAIYVTALGEQSRPEQPIPDPLHYFVYEDTINRWQLGRLAERINTLGTLRLASLMHFEKMRTMEGELQAVERRIATALSFARNTSPDNLTSAQNVLVSLWDDYSSLQNSLSPYRTVGAGDPLNGGLDYRVERSRYYQGQFFRSLDSLRILRVEGFQPYDEFVKRRLGGAFDSIDRLGSQFGRMQADLVTLFQYSQTLRSLEMEINIRARNEEIATTQEAADLILFAVLLPYYGSGIIGHSMELMEVEPIWQHLLYVLAIGFGISQFVSRKWALNSRVRTLVLAAALSAAFIVWVQIWIGWGVFVQSALALVQNHTGLLATIGISPPPSRQSR